ncbi:hypothetical protein X975_25136, partial [Stegodyphus mimosarum]
MSASSIFTPASKSRDAIGFAYTAVLLTASKSGPGSPRSWDLTTLAPCDNRNLTTSGQLYRQAIFRGVPLS